MDLIRKLAAALAVALAVCHVAPAGQETASTSQEVIFLDELFAFDEKRPLVGVWIGNIRMPDDPVRAGVLKVSIDESARHHAVLTCIQLNALDTDCGDVYVDDRLINFTHSVGGITRLFQGRVSADGQRMTGIVNEDVQTRAGYFTFARSPRPYDLGNELAFSGGLKVTNSLTIPLAIVVARTPGGSWVGHVDSPVEGLYELPLINIQEKEKGRSTKLTCTVLGFPATLSFSIRADRERLIGIYVQEPYELPLDFERAHGYAGARVARPQHPTPPLPYEAREVYADHPDGHILAGTLTVPDRKRFGPGPFPTALLVSGGGQQDRDETVLGHKPFLVIADYLTRHGIAVMRYDDRGVGGSAVRGGSAALGDLTTEDWATDTVAVLDRIRSIAVVDRNCVGLIGHSEGGLIGPMIASRDPSVAFVILMGAPGVPGREVLPLQMSLLLRAAGASEADGNAYRDLAEQAVDLVLRDDDRDGLKKVLTQMARIRVKAGDPLSVEALADRYESALTAPWVRFYLAYDPRPTLAAVSCPVLALNGTLDMQVWHDQNLPEIERVMKQAGGDITIRRYDGLNHLFQPAANGGVAEYMEIETTIDEQVLADIVKWIRSRIQDAPRTDPARTSDDLTIVLRNRPVKPARGFRLRR